MQKTAFTALMVLALIGFAGSPGRGTGRLVQADPKGRLVEFALGMTPVAADGLGWRGSDQGTRMKQGGGSGFDAELAGWRSGSGTLGFRGEHGNFWTATSVDSRAYERLLNVRRATVGRDLGNKTCGFSVRCVRRVP